MSMNFQLLLVKFSGLLSLKFEMIFIQVKNANILEENTFFNLYNVIICLLLGISIIANILLLIAVKNRNRKLKVAKNKPKADIGSLDYEKLKNSNEALNRQIGSLKRQLYDSQNKSKSADSNEYHVNNETSNTQFIEEVEEIAQTVNLEITQPNILYLPSPFDDNRFSIEDVSKEQTSSSLYKIILDSSNRTGKLLIIENADFTRALNSPDHYLENACVYENAFSSTANGIIVVDHGKVKLEGQDWIITDKVKVKFV